MPPDKVIFNQELAIDLVWLEKKLVLHIVENHTEFQNAIPISTKRAEDIWYEFVEGWASLYVGYPNLIRLDQESSFKSDIFE